MSFEKFNLLCWKNFTLQKRHPIAGLFEICFPIVIVLLFTFARNNTTPTNHNELKFDSFTPNNSYDKCSFWTHGSIQSIGVSPGGNPALEDLIRSSIGAKIETQFYGNATDLEQFLNSANFSVAGIEFDDSLSVSTYSIKGNN